MRKVLKIVLIILLCAGVAVGGTIGILTLVKGSGGDLYVYPVSDYAMGEYWGNATEYYGNVTLDDIQPVYLSSTQQLKEILVQEGDQVAEGDPLLSYDTTLSEVSLEKKNLAVQKLELQLANLKAQLNVINSYVPYVPPVVTPTPTPEPTPTPIQPEKLPALLSGTGTYEDPYVFLWPSDGVFDKAFITAMLDGARKAYGIFLIHEENLITNPVTQEWDICFLIREDDSLGFYMFEKYVPDDPTDKPDPEEDQTSGFTWAEIAQMRSDCEESIRSTELQIRIEKLEYQQMKLEADNGIVYSSVDGVVKTINTGEAAMTGQEPVVYVSGGGGGFVVTCQISELDRDTCVPGQTVTITSWMTGTIAQGTVTALSDTPVPDEYYGGEQNVSFYPFYVSVPEDAGLVEYDYVSVTPENQQVEGGTGLYLMKPFLQTESGHSYVWVRTEDGTITRREVETGATVWGEYVQIRSGLTMEDYVAFPYGKALREGAPTVEGDRETLYGAGY